MRSLIWISILSLSTLATAQPQARTVDVRLSNFDFAPNAIRLRAGEPIVLRLVNSARGGHDFAAAEFFAAASGVSGPVSEGKIEVAGHASAEIRLTPARGRYRLRCTHMMHTAFGMAGEIIVE